LEVTTLTQTKEGVRVEVMVAMQRIAALAAQADEATGYKARGDAALRGAGDDLKAAQVHTALLEDRVTALAREVEAVTERE
jgi:hypothetical protein